MDLSPTDTTLSEYEMKEEEVLKQLNLVTISKREVELVSHNNNTVIMVCMHVLFGFKTMYNCLTWFVLPVHEALLLLSC